MGPLSELALFISINWRAHAKQQTMDASALRGEPIEKILEELAALAELEKKTGRTEVVDTEVARAHLGAMLLNLMRYCDLAGVEGDTLGEWIADYYRSLPTPADEGILTV